MAMSDDSIPAATLIVIRDREDSPPDLLTVTRAKKMTFAGGAIVFPGGRIDDSDHWPVHARDFDDSASRIAAIRETLEESGIPAGLSPLPDPKLTRELQNALHLGDAFATILSANGIGLNLAALTPFTRWKPAFKHARVFDTLFYLVRAPHGEWIPRHQPGECEAVEWMSAIDALERIEHGTASAIFPTKRNLERLALFASYDEAVADAARHPVELITPWIEQRDGQDHVCIPQGLGYPVTAEPLATAFRA
jgi:8-oxo-dGTP pyrophosphatase MutT (NUDIX family)